MEKRCSDTLKAMDAPPAPRQRALTKLNHDTPRRGFAGRHYACPRTGESRDEYALRFRRGLLALVEMRRPKQGGNGDDAA